MDETEKMEEIENIQTNEAEIVEAETEAIVAEVENVEAVSAISEAEVELVEVETEIPEEEAGIGESEKEISEVTVVDINRPDAKWYAIRTFTGHEAKVKLSIEAEVKRLKLQDRILEVIIPQETVFEVRGGKRRTKIKNFLPGYILVKAVMDKKIIEIITTVPSVVSFVGNKTQPSALQPHEIERIIGRVEERKSIATIITRFEIGDPVKVIEGPFTNFNGTVKEVNHEKQKLKVEVGILGRKTPVELDFSQVELENH
jgi:transcriptional antiterminator NusG